MPFVKAVGRGAKLRRDLTYEEAKYALRLILNGEASDAQAGAFLIAQRVKGESLSEVRGFTDLVRQEFVQPLTPNVDRLLDLATPYDGKLKTAQLAPAVALVLAAAGLPILLHGATEIPTKSGITVGQVLQGLGVPTDLTPSQATSAIEQHEFAYIDARQFAPAWHELTPLRHHFGLRTVFNTVEKWFNPANAPFQISGFFHANYIEAVRLAQTGSELSFMVQGEEGSIEMAAGRRTPLFAVSAENDRIVDPADVGLPLRERIALPPELKQHVTLNQQVLSGEAGTATDQVALTAGALLTLFAYTNDLPSGYQLARVLLKEGAAQAKLTAIISKKQPEKERI